MKHYYIYLITNKINGKTYVGQHHGELNDDYMGSGNLIIQSQLKYGMDNFVKEILAVCNTKQEIDVLEKEYIKLYREIGKAEYNIADGGEGSFNLTEEQEQKRLKGVRSYWTTKEGQLKKQELSELNKDKKNTKGKHWYNNGKENVVAFECPEGFVKGKLSDYRPSEEVKQRIRNSTRSFYNSEESLEARQKISQANKGIVFSEERKRHISEARKGKGRPQSEETRRKISEWWARKRAEKNT